MDAPSGLPAGFAVGTSGDEATQATLALEQAVSDAAQTHKVVDSTWQVKDFFLLSESEEVILKKQIASKLGIHYGNANQDKPFAEDFGGIKAYTVDGITAAREAFRTKMLDSDITGPARAKALADSCHLSLVVSGCLIKWKPAQAVNEGYVEDWMRKNVVPGKWDSSVERRAALAQDVRPLAITTSVNSVQETHRVQTVLQLQQCLMLLPRTLATFTS